MPLSESRIPALFFILSALTLVACTSDDDGPKAPKPEINTINVLFTQNDPADNTTPSNNIYFYTEKNETLNSLGKFNKGEGAILTLDTNPEKQGYEHALLAIDERVSLLDYDKDARNRIRPLIETTGSICALHPFDYIDEARVLGSANPEAALAHRTRFFVETNAGPCEENQNVVYRVDFSLVVNDQAFNESDTFFNRVSYAHINGAHIEGPESISLTPDGGLETNNYYLGHDPSGDLIVFFDDDRNPVWTAPLQGSPERVEILQSSGQTVLIRADGDIHVLPLETLLDAGIGDGISSETTIIPSADVIQLLLQNPTFTISTPEPIKEQVASTADAFVLIDNNTAYYYSEEDGLATAPLAIATDPNFVSMEASIREGDNRLFIVKTNTDSMHLSSLQLPAGSETGTLVSADRIEMFVQSERVFVNTFDSSAPSMDAHLIDADMALHPYTDSQILVAESPDEQDLLPYILRSELPATLSGLSEPSLYQFDADSDDGIKRTLNSDGELEPFSYGTLVDTYFRTFAFGQINDLYAHLSVQNELDETMTYFFNPEQQTSMNVLPGITTPSAAND